MKGKKLFAMLLASVMACSVFADAPAEEVPALAAVPVRRRKAPPRRRAAKAAKTLRPRPAALGKSPGRIPTR